MTTAAGTETLDELEASFLAFDVPPDLQQGMPPLRSADLLPLGPLDDPAMAVSVRTRSTRCC
ncbi:MAG TPA: hypothetical protein VFN44_07725 [Solirubrobacteraceae bacterium]|nr:hypothetical protein [Solirubrobacteraceae bacterium]